MHTETLPSYIDRAAARARAGVARISFVTLLVLGAALLPRVLGLADFFTIDEADHWILRVRLFSEALSRHNWAHQPDWAPWRDNDVARLARSVAGTCKWHLA